MAAAGAGRLFAGRGGIATALDLYKGEEGAYGHYTNGVVNFQRIFSYDPANAANPTCGLFDSCAEITAMSIFFALYDQNWDTKKDNIYLEDITGYDPQVVNVGENDAHFYPTIDGVTPPTINVGYKLHLLNSRFNTCTTPTQKRNLKLQVRENLEKYLATQLIYCFVCGSGNYGARGYRLYFCKKSLDLFQQADEIVLEIKNRPVMSHLLKEENVALQRNWNYLINKLKEAFPTWNTDGAHIQINFAERANLVSDLKHDLHATNPTVSDIRITMRHLDGLSYEENQANMMGNLVRLYQVCRCFKEEIWNQRNKYVEFFTYEFVNPAYNHTFRARLRNVSGHGHVESTLNFPRHQGFIGQGLRYIALSQTNYRMNIGLGGIAARDIGRPEFIHIRDAHHATPTFFETALMSAFNRSGKRYFFTNGGVDPYARRWHDVRRWVTPGDRRGDASPAASGEWAKTLQDDPYSGIRPNDNNKLLTQSNWAGLQSFRALAAADQCVFGTVKRFVDTFGVMFHHHELVQADDGRMEQIRDLAYGIRIRSYGTQDGKGIYQRDTNPPPAPQYFTYGIDERILVNCFYSTFRFIWGADGRIVRGVGGRMIFDTSVRFPTNAEKAAVISLQRGVPAEGAPSTLAGILSECFFHDISLGWVSKNHCEILGDNRSEGADGAIGEIRVNALKVRGGLIENYNGETAIALARPAIRADAAARVARGVLGGGAAADKFIADRVKIVGAAANKLGPQATKIFTYLRVRGQYPKTHHDLLSFCEKAKDFSNPLFKELPFESLYHECTLLFRSYNQQWLAEGILVTYNEILPKQTVDLLRTLWGAVTALDSTINCNDRHKKFALNPLIKGYTIRNYLPRAAAAGVAARPENTNWCVDAGARPAGSTYCYGDGRDLSTAAGPNNCLTQPIDLITTGREADRLYRFRGIRNTPAPIPAFREWGAGGVFTQFGGNGNGEKLNDAESVVSNLPTLPVLSSDSEILPMASSIPLASPPRPLGSSSLPATTAAAAEIPISTFKSTEEDIHKCILLVVGCSVMSAEEIMSARPIALAVLAEFISDPTFTRYLTPIVEKLYPTVTFTEEEGENLLFADTFTNNIRSEFYMFLLHLKEYHANYNNSNPLLFLDIHLGLSDEPLVHVNTFLKDSTFQLEKVPEAYQEEKQNERLAKVNREIHTYVIEENPVFKTNRNKTRKSRTNKAPNNTRNSKRHANILHKVNMSKANGVVLPRRMQIAVP